MPAPEGRGARPRARISAIARDGSRAAEFVLTEDETRVGSEVAVTFHPDILQAMAAGRGPRRSVFTVGYAGWAPDQLETEIKGGYWFIAAAEAGIIFDDAYATKWDRAMSRRRISL